METTAAASSVAAGFSEAAPVAAAGSVAAGFSEAARVAAEASVDGAVFATSAVAVAVAGAGSGAGAGAGAGPTRRRLEFLDDLGLLGAAPVEVGVAVAEAEDEEPLLRVPPPTGTLRRDPPLVQ